MPHRSVSIVTLVSSICISLLSLGVHAQDQSLPEVKNAEQQFEGMINSNAVFIRSGPGENYYPTMKLDRGATVKVVGIRYEWLKIVPPEGSFSYVAKAYVEKRGDGSLGRVTRPDLNVRAGSGLNAMKTSVQTRLNENDDVKIVGEQDEYFQIVPPADAYLYVNKRFVDPVKPLVAEETAEEPEIADSEPEATEPDETLAEQPTPDGDAMAVAPTTQQSTDANATAAATPTTNPSDPLAADQQFDALETQFASASQQPIESQPVEELMQSYQELVQNDQLPESMRRIAEHRISTLKVRAEAKENYLAVQQIQEEMNQRQMALKAEREELETRIKENEVKLYTAVGTLSTSSLQQGREMLYRLTDPANGRTVVYVRTNEPQYATMLGQFVGVTGEMVSDEQLRLKVVTPTAVETVDPAKVNNGVVAQVAPPSLLPKTHASTDLGEGGQ